MLSNLFRIQWVLIGVFVGAGPVAGDPFSLLGNTHILGRSGALLNAKPTENAVRVPSLFLDRKEGSLFAPYPERQIVRHSGARPSGYHSPVVRVRQLIGSAESRSHGYDAIQHGAKIRPNKRPTQMTIGEIYAWIDATPGQPHAIGRYQFIPKTLYRLVDRLALDANDVFTTDVQDQLSDILLNEAGYGAFRSGQITRHAFMNNLAKIWAGLPTSSGRSYYDGYAGNKASITWGEFDAEMARIFPG